MTRFGLAMLALDWISPGHHSTRDLLGDVLKFGNVQDGAAGGILREAVGIKVETDFDGVFHDPGHVVIGDVVMRAVRKADAKGLEGLGEKQFANLFGRNHGRSIGVGAVLRKRPLGFVLFPSPAVGTTKFGAQGRFGHSWRG